MLPQKLHNLPHNGKRIFYKFYDRSLRKFGSKEIAVKLAVCAVRKKYTLIDGQWRARPDANEADTTSSSSATTTTSSSSDESDENNYVPFARHAV
ncbi:chab-like protein [Spilosoma obliqua nucleopolyhedrosis virus]|uniref:FP protein n=2 Tax=Alphabaculovirus TaxID=558016 RepID=Q2NP20_NPVHC|nr:FP protein [Hyphantria cunea nucleopolyhedrovirus]AUR45116.1 chab-like protein [Spilosoma obliqua nucleopolyhedrosis virus]QNN89410.1 FP protein [Spilarctia obliqua nucleopolyhedrovirus]BAE72380.1 FP protein [Hyphantria cunea nucleopolyhedrovirus]